LVNPLLKQVLSDVTKPIKSTATAWERYLDMAAITAQSVKELRQKTDLPMMECKQALTECSGDLAEALEWLRKKHKGKMQERAGRETGEGRIAVYINETGTVGALVELQCETAPVGKNEMFVELAVAIAKRVAEGNDDAPDPEVIRADPAVDQRFTEVFGRLRETMNLRKCRRLAGNFLCSYIHHDGKSGVLLALDAKPKSDKNIGADLCMHAVFTKPIAVDRTGVPAEQIEKVRVDAVEAAKADGKPDQIVAKIADGKVNAFFAERVLMEQLHVKTDEYGKTKIADCLKQAGVGGVTGLIIMKLGD